ncbi:hypothetical protein CYMTET_37294, partial [Cymbomonas tetramitiformis]
MAQAEDLSISFQASRDPELLSVQRSLVQAWGYANQLYVDPSFNGQGAEGWKDNLQRALTSTFTAEDATSAQQEVEIMLSSLGDQFTRVVRPDFAEAYLQLNEGEVQSLGIVAMPSEQQGGEMAAVVTFIIEGSPAQEAGVRVGETLLEVNGRSVVGLTQRQLQGLMDQGSLPETQLTLQEGDRTRTVAVRRGLLPVIPVQFSQVSVELRGPASSECSVGDLAPSCSPDHQ